MVFHIYHVVREQVSGLPFRQQVPELRQRVRSAQKGSQGARAAHSFEYDFRGRAKVNENTRGPQEFQGARYRDPPAPWSEDHPGGVGELLREAELECAKGGLAPHTKELGHRAPGPALDFLVEVQEWPAQLLRDRHPHRGFPRAREAGQDKVRRAIRWRQGRVVGVELVRIGTDYSNERECVGGGFGARSWFISF